MTPTLPVIEEITESKSKVEHSWRVILYNDHIHSRDEVVLWLQKATGCSLQAAEAVMMTAHTTGRAICFSGDKQDCHKVAGNLRGRGLQVEVDDF